MSNGNANSTIKFENFKLEVDNSTHINSAITILLIGIPILSLPFLNILNIYNGPPEPSMYPQYFGDIANVAQNILIFSTFFGESFFVTSIMGWSVGSFIAAVLFGTEGKSGPLYASYLLFRFWVGTALILLPLGFLSNFFLFDLALIIPIFTVLLVISLPLILVGSIAYRIGLWISPK